MGLELLMALSPALIAIALALWTKRVALSLLMGVLVGSFVVQVQHWGSSEEIWFYAVFLRSMFDAVAPGLSDFTLQPDLTGSGWSLGLVSGDLAALDPSHLMVTAFSICVAGMVGILGDSGSTRAMVRWVERFAKGRVGAMVSAWIAGGLVFFDDYANCLVVGSSMGPVFDRFKVSRAKLAYIVDSTAAPVASIALVSTWVAYEVGLIADELAKAGSEADALPVLLAAIPYRFYGFVTLAMVGAIAISGRDFGPMLEAEREALQVEPAPVSEANGETVGNPWVAVSSVAILLVVVLGYLVVQGAYALPTDVTLWEAPLFEVIGGADPFEAMLVGSLVSAVVASVGALLTGSLSATKLVPAFWGSTKPVLAALGVLLMAWALGNTMSDTGAARALSGLVAPTNEIEFVGEPRDIEWHAAQDAAGGELVIRSPSGQVVKRADLPAVAAGPGSFAWDGRDDEGTALAVGTYEAALLVKDASGADVHTIVRGRAWFPAWILPALVFVVAAATAFATGTSFGTMGILIPLAIPLSVWMGSGEVGPILLGSTSAVLAGAIFGDHASPISDTTVLSALGSGVPLVDHMRTQLPYALTAGAVSLIVGYLPAGLGWSPWLLMPVACVIVVAAVWILGKRPESA